ncbi:large subunit ribosomal protein L50 [Paragonimus westermani]|uniref:Large ribosomal subunit protein mL50 n=1 Tax=Paragonimus westermani TaxID=34504 RepID=A0A5J4NWH0_9TREM|nr:large subunit ribosomal protein L50 [Paragonimus westermani]
MALGMSLYTTGEHMVKGAPNQTDVKHCCGTTESLDFTNAGSIITLRLKSCELNRTDLFAQVFEGFFPAGTRNRDNLIAKLPPYAPPTNVSSRIQSFAVRLLNANPSNPSAYRFQSNAEKFKLFTACAREFQHPVLNSYIHELTDVSALIQYYQTPVASPDALSRLCEQADQLPSNLSIATKPIRFNPNDTTFFKRTAYPGRSTIVSGLGTAKKYRGFRAPPTRRIRVEYQDRI